MNEQQNTQTVQEVFAAYGRGDIATVLSALTDDVEWWMPGPPRGIPYAGLRRGPEQVTQFFISMGGAVEFEQFEPREYIAQGDQVVALGHVKARSRQTGRPFEHDWAMVFTFRGGKVARFRQYEDTSSLVEAFRGA